jgi:hypothetical protein
VKQENWFAAHKILSILLLTFIIAAIAGIMLMPKNDTKQEGQYNNPENNSASKERTDDTVVETIEPIHFSAKNWDEDPEVDGLEFYLFPKNRYNNAVRSPGIISIKLWRIIKSGEKFECSQTKEDLLEHWDNLSVNVEDYGFLGATIGVGYREYKPTKDKYAMGCAEAVFTIPDGRNFKYLDDTVFINGVPES